MRVVNLAHGSLYLLGAYIGWSIDDATGNWILAVITAPLIVAVIGIILQQGLLRRIQGQDLREAMVTIGVSIVVADLLLAYYGGQSHEFSLPDAINTSTNIALAAVTYPTFRPFTFVTAYLFARG